MTQKKKTVLTSKAAKPKKKQPLTVEIALQQRQNELELINKELARSQVELEAAYRQYTDLYDFAPVGYLTLARNGAIHQVNLAGANLLGVNHDEVTQLCLAAFVSDKSRRAFNIFFEKLLSGEGKETCELVLEKNNGDGLLWVRIEATCFEGGNVCRVMLTDINERRRMASLLQARVRISEFAESHTFDELLQKTLDEIEVLTDSQIGFAHFIGADQKTLQLQMWSTNTMKNKCTAEGKGLHYPIDQAGVWADCVSTRAPLIHNDYANLACRKGLPQGHAPVLRELVVPVLRNELIVMIMGVGNKSTDYDDNDIETLSQLANLAWDIVQRKQAEEFLKESEWRNRIVSELTTDYIFVVDVDPSGILKLRWASDNLFRITGRTVEDAATSDIWNNIIHQDDRVRFFDFVNKTLSTAEAGELECRSLNKHGGERWIHIFARPQVGKKNSVMTIVGAIQDITERKQAEEALRESQELFSLFMLHSPIYAFIKEVTSTKSRVLQASDNYLQMIGISGQDMVGKTMEELFPAEAAAKFTDDDWSVVSSGKVLKLDEDLNGRHYNSIKFPIIQGDKTLLAGYTIDITERVRAEQALRESESLYRKMNENSPLGMHFYNLNNSNQLIFVGANPAADKLLGMDNSQFIGKTIEEAFPPLVKTEVPERYRDTVAKGIPWSTEQITYEDRQVVGAFEVRAFQTTQGNMVAVFSDITERKQMEEALRVSEEKYRTVANFTYDWETWRGPDNVYRYVSPSCERVTGHTVMEFLADSNLIVKIAHPEDQPQVGEHFNVSFNEAKEQDLHLDFRIITPDGQIRWLAHYCTAVYGEDGQWLGRRESNRDITERKQAEAELQYMKDGLEAANRELQTALALQQQLAHTDALTGINNRRHLYELTEHESEIAARYLHPLSAIMFDIDHFKEVNDTFGHAIGDQILQRVTQVACAKLRSADVIGRYGGEEFVIILPMTNAKQAYPLAERIRVGVAAIHVPTEKGDATVTLSIGIVEMIHGARTASAESLIRRADEAMYAAKQAGRNRTEIGWE